MALSDAQKGYIAPYTGCRFNLLLGVSQLTWCDPISHFKCLVVKGSIQPQKTGLQPVFWGLFLVFYATNIVRCRGPARGVGAFKFI